MIGNYLQFKLILCFFTQLCKCTCMFFTCVRDMYIYCMSINYIFIVDTSYINHTVLEGYDSFVFLVSFLLMLSLLNLIMFGLV